ncbi:MAG: sigma-70 family RNA polymerase sigma factor [Patescibacteria group bacterium]|jgi:RNA polymerase sigma-70 factor (ECF subfamily)|nr:sigma-70 family RNA polymerase sigma factor [Patescibacteria group bacterium]
MQKPYNELTDNELVELSKIDSDVFGELVLRYQNRLFYYIKRISYFNEEDIEDIIQEVFIKVYRGLNSFDGDLTFSTWIYQISRNATIDAIRKKQVRPQSARMEEDDMIKIFKSNIDIKNEFEIKEHLSKIKDIMRKLPYKYKEVMVLRFLEERTYEEIMDIVQKPKGTVAALIARGRKMLIKEATKKELLIN